MPGVYVFICLFVGMITHKSYKGIWLEFSWKVRLDPTQLDFDGSRDPHLNPGQAF